MRLTSSRAYTRSGPAPKMPPGLVELMEGLSKDVLRNNPSNVYEFCANHLEKLLELRDGPSSKKLPTLKEKISKAQETVRQRAIERRELFDNKVRRAADYAPENGDPGKGQDTTQEDIVSSLRAPIHHDHELSSLSEMEISHEPTDNSLTSKESIYDEADEIPISKSSTVSSVTKSTVLDLITGTDHKTNTKEDTDDGNDNMDVLEIHEEEQIKHNEGVNDNNYIELPKIEISNDEAARKDTGSQKVYDQKDEVAIEKNIQPSCDNIDKIQKTFELLVSENNDNQVVQKESEYVITITCEENPTEKNGDLVEEQSSTTVKYEIENEYINNLKSLVGKEIIEEANITTIIDTSNDITSKTEIHLIVEADKIDDKNNIIEHEDEKVTNEITKRLVPTENLYNETENNNGITVGVTDNSAESLKKITQPEPVNHNPNNIIEVKTSSDSGGRDSDIKEIFVQIDKTNDSVNVSDPVYSEGKITTSDSMEKDITVEGSESVVTAEEKSEIFEDTTVVSTANMNELTAEQKNEIFDDTTVDAKANMNELTAGKKNEIFDDTTVDSTANMNELTAEQKNEIFDDTTVDAKANMNELTAGKKNEIFEDTTVDSTANMNELTAEQKNEIFDDNTVDAKANMNELTAGKKNEIFEDTTVESTANINKHNDSEDKYIFTVDEEILNKEDNVNSNSTSFQEPSSAENNDDSGVIRADLSKAEDYIPQSNNKNGENNMDLETAAVTIQKVFRSFLFKSGNSTFEDITNDEALEKDNNKSKEEYYAAAANLNKERRPLGITRMDTVLQTVNEEKSLSLSTDDSSTLSSAATTIQAHVRGFLVRNRLNSYKTVSTNSLVNSNEMLDTDTELQKNKTVLNIHIVPEEGNYLSRDESLITSMDLSLDGSPPSSLNLHPLSYDLVSERRKLLKREDAIQSVSPPSNNSGKLSEDSVKEILMNEDISKTESNINDKDGLLDHEHDSPETLVTVVPDATVPKTLNEQEDTDIDAERLKRSISSDESDVITPFTASPRSLVSDFEHTSKLIHSGEFHDVVLPTKVSRSDATVVREFKNVLAYILLWNHF